MGNLESQSYNALNLYNENNNNCENNFNRSKSCSMQNLRTLNNDAQTRGINILLIFSITSLNILLLLISLPELNNFNN